MGNSQLTKETLLKVAGALFNTHGYKATSISDITRESGYSKGAIYRHFNDKEALEKAAFQFLLNKLTGTLRIEIRSVNSAPAKLKSILKFYKGYDKNPPIPGGCPLLNAAIEVDDTYPELRALARETLITLQETIEHIIQKGKKYQQIDLNVDAFRFANIFIASIEGSVMMNKLQPGKNYLAQTCEFLEEQIDKMTITI